MAAGGGGVSVAAGGNRLGHDDNEGWEDLEPFFFDEVEAVADHERRMRRQQEDAQRAAQKAAQRLQAANAKKAVMDKIEDYDPKQYGKYYNRFYYADFSKFDIDEESPLEPMRYTNIIYNEGDEREKIVAVNILSVKIASLDVGFPIDVYGTVIFRDSIDYKCVYLFRRDRDNCQPINSKDESLILTGPKRGLYLLGDVHVEFDLKIMIKDHQVQEEKELSKGWLTIGGAANRYLNRCEVDSDDLATRLSTMEVIYAVVGNAVEATISVEVLRGEFYGEITACTTRVPNPLVLHDSKVAAGVMNNSTGVIQLLRSAVSVSLEEMLLVTVVAETGDAECERTITFAPYINQGDGDVISLGATRMLVKIAWSLICR